MGAVIDAHIVKGVYEEHIGAAGSLTGSASEVLAEITAHGLAVWLDDGEQMENEWRHVVPDEWFDGWFADLASEANVSAIRRRNCEVLIRKLGSDFGFPRSRDRILLSVAVAGVAHEGAAMLLTEDVDFYDPKMKGQPKVRSALLTGKRAGPVRSFLRKTEKVSVCSVTLALNGGVAAAKARGEDTTRPRP